MTPPAAHDASPPPVAGDPSSFPTHAELARTLLADGGHATLTTMTDDGLPYPSLVAYSTLDDAGVLICISDLAEHTQNARARPEAGLLVTAPANGRDPLDEPRLSIVGRLDQVDITAEVRERHLGVHPHTAFYMDGADFNWWRLTTERARFVGGFGWMGWITADDLASAEADPVLPHTDGAVDHMNEDHTDANLAMAHHAGVAEATAAKVTGIDRHGMNLWATTPDGGRFVRLRFEEGPLDDPGQVRPAVVALSRRASSAAS